MNPSEMSDRLWHFAARVGKVVDALPDIWNAVLDKPLNEVDAIVQTKMDIVAQRLKLALKG